MQVKLVIEVRNMIATRQRYYVYAHANGKCGDWDRTSRPMWYGASSPFIYAPYMRWVSEPAPCDEKN